MKRTFFPFILLLLLVPAYAGADSLIGDGKLFVCVKGEPRSVKLGKAVKKQAAVRRFKRMIHKKKAVIQNSFRGSKKRTRAVTARQIARQALKDAKTCQGGPRARLQGSWTLAAENALAPEQAGFASLTVVIAGGDFLSTLVSNSAVCSWRGPFKVNEESISIQVKQAFGAPCESTLGQTRTARYLLSADGNALILDFTAHPGGTIQEYRRAS